ncbi:hypothetical protein ACOSQ3_015185 [Xanthoceras sorbifolium]
MTQRRLLRLLSPCTPVAIRVMPPRCEEADAEDPKASRSEESELDLSDEKNGEGSEVLMMGSETVINRAKGTILSEIRANASSSSGLYPSLVVDNLVGEKPEKFVVSIYEEVAKITAYGINHNGAAMGK